MVQYQPDAISLGDGDNMAQSPAVSMKFALANIWF